VALGGATLVGMTAVLDGPLRPPAAPGRAPAGRTAPALTAPEATVAAPAVGGPAVVEAALPAATVVAPSTAALIGPAPRLRPARCRPAAAGMSPAPGAPRVPRLPDHPDARVVVVRALRLACEVLDGRRPFAHLAAHAEPVVLRYWRAAAATRRSASPTRIGHPHLQHPCDGAAEVATALVVGGRPRALAARFDLVDGRWRWTAVRLG
jgi:hypothetical protein